VDSTDDDRWPGGADLVAAAAEGQLPDWVEMSDNRRAHAARVAALLDSWALRLGLDASARARWRAAGWLHDALKGADPETLRDQVDPEFRDFPGATLHGPAAAARLASLGVTDAGLLRAIAYHTVGHPDLDRLGRALYLADYLEPGRAADAEMRAELRSRMPHEFDAVLREVIAHRIRHSLARHRAIRPETMSFWNAVVSESPGGEPVGHGPGDRRRLRPDD